MTLPGWIAVVLVLAPVVAGCAQPAPSVATSSAAEPLVVPSGVSGTSTAPSAPPPSAAPSSESATVQPAPTTTSPPAPTTWPIIRVSATATLDGELVRIQGRAANLGNGSYWSYCPAGGWRFEMATPNGTLVDVAYPGCSGPELGQNGVPPPNYELAPGATWTYDIALNRSRPTSTYRTLILPAGPYEVRARFADQWWSNATTVTLPPSGEAVLRPAGSQGLELGVGVEASGGIPNLHVRLTNWGPTQVPLRCDGIQVFVILWSESERKWLWERGSLARGQLYCQDLPASIAPGATIDWSFGLTETPHSTATNGLDPLPPGRYEWEAILSDRTAGQPGQDARAAFGILV